MQSKFPLALMLGTSIFLSACFDYDDERTAIEGVDAPVALNSAPTISGAPPAHILEGQAYEFTPSASDPDGDALEFAIGRKPAWATFDKTTGRLAGTPKEGDVGNFTNIGITVSDGRASTALPTFNITVNQIAFGAATLSWQPPTENSDGSSMSDLAGYRIYYGRDANTLSQSVVLDNPGLTRYVVENLTPAIWHFSMTSVNAGGVESRRSETVSKTIG